MNNKIEKLSYEELIKALDCCAHTLETNMCGECPAAKYEAGKCDDLVKLQAAEMLKDLKAENKQLNRKVNRLKKYDEKRDIDLHSRLTAIARIEAIKEYEGKLKMHVYRLPHTPLRIVSESWIDVVSKEMLGGSL